MSHPKAREWIVSAARANYQELAKLANEHPMLVHVKVRTGTQIDLTSPILNTIRTAKLA